LVKISVFEIHRGPNTMVQEIFSITRSKDSSNDSFEQPARKTITLFLSFARGCTLFVWRQRTKKKLRLMPYDKKQWKPPN